MFLALIINLSMFLVSFVEHVGELHQDNLMHIKIIKLHM